MWTRCKIKENKFYTQDKAIEIMALPSIIYIPLTQHTGKICDKLEVKVGDIVLKGQLLATSEAKIYAPIHASISGEVTAIQDWPHPLLGRSKAIIIESDGLDKTEDIGQRVEVRWQRTEEEVKKFTSEQIREIIFKAGIVGMGGAGFPTHIKLNPPKPIDTLIVNGAECEPYLTGDYRLMIEKTREILLGIELIAKCLGAKNVFIAIEDNKPEAIKQFIVHRSEFIVKILKSAYPQGGEKQLIKNIVGREVPFNKLPFDIGVVVHNVATVFAIYEAVYFNKPLYERVVTVTGSCLTNPKNLLVRIGTPLKDLIDFCGPLKEQPVKIITGGPMMGIAQYSDKAVVIKSTTGIILFNEKEVGFQEEEFCIRCGACIRDCPIGLMPCLISLASQNNNWELAKIYNVLDCIECGLCSYVCPAKRNMVQYIKHAKLMLLQ